MGLSGRVARSSTGAKTQSTPSALASSAVISPLRRASASEPEAPRAMLEGSAVAPRTHWPAPFS